jgi:hypothetical protein
MNEITLIIDRFEGDKAVCEGSNRKMFTFPRSALPPEAREGDVIVLAGREARIDRDATDARKKAAEERLRKSLKDK